MGLNLIFRKTKSSLLLHKFYFFKKKITINKYTLPLKSATLYPQEEEARHNLSYNIGYFCSIFLLVYFIDQNFRFQDQNFQHTLHQNDKEIQ